MPHRFRALGFSLRGEEDLHEVLHRAGEAGERRQAPRGTYVVWAPGAGIELWLQRNSRGQVTGCSPHFSGLGRMRMGVSRAIVDPGSPLDGKLYGWADPASDDPQSGAYAFVLEVPDMDLIRDRLRVPARVTVQPVAFARGLQCFRDDGEFAASQTEGDAWPPESFVATGLYDADGEEREEAEPEAAFAGHVQHAELRVNPVTAEPFHYLVVRTLGGVIDVVADPLTVTGAPVTGGVVQGTCSLSARIIGGLPPSR